MRPASVSYHAGRSGVKLLSTAAAPDRPAAADRGLYQLARGVLTPVDAAPASLAVSRSWRDADGALWHSNDVALYRDGILQLDSRGQIRDLMFGHVGSVWISTLRDGVYALHEARVDLLNSDSAMVSDNIYSVSRANDGSMWLGSLGGGLQRIDRDGKVRSYGLEAGLPGLNPWVVAVAPDSSVYAATYAPGLYHMAAGAERFAPLALPRALFELPILALSFAPDARLWVGTTCGAWREDKDQCLEMSFIIFLCNLQMFLFTVDTTKRSLSNLTEILGRLITDNTEPILPSVSHNLGDNLIEIPAHQMTQFFFPFVRLLTCPLNLSLTAICLNCII